MDIELEIVHNEKTKALTSYLILLLVLMSVVIFLRVTCNILTI